MSANQFMHQELALLLGFAGWLIVAVLGLAVLALCYLGLRRLLHNILAPRGFSPEKITAIGWIVVPLAVLLVLAIPAARMLYRGDEPPYLTVSVTAHEWYWHYDYVSAPGLGFDSRAVPRERLPPGAVYGDIADHPLVVPAGEKIRFLVTSGDVMHGFFVAALGLQIYALPGALLTGWTVIARPGLYDGESSPICGDDHQPMPIQIKALPLPAYRAWLAAQRG